ncbi:hypothetical protein D3C80_2006990 [compost metagenome]
MESEARKSNTRVISDQEGFNHVLKYFGIPVQEQQQAITQPEFSVSTIDDLL